MTCHCRFMISHPEHLVTKAAFATYRQTKWFWQLPAIVVDEAHTVVQWGDEDFKPAFKELRQLRSCFRQAKMVAITATATKSSQAKLENDQNMKNFQVCTH